MYITHSLVHITHGFANVEQITKWCVVVYARLGSKFLAFKNKTRFSVLTEHLVLYLSGSK